MTHWWHHLGQLLWCAGTPAGFVVVVSMSTLGGLITASVLVAIKVSWSIPQIWREVLAESRVQRWMKRQNGSGHVHGAPASGALSGFGEKPPCSDL